MKVQLKSIYAGPNVTAQPGSIIDFPDEEGRALIDGKYGVLVEDAASKPAAPETPADAAETAEAPAAPETAAARSPSRGSRSRTSAASKPAAPETE